MLVGDYCPRGLDPIHEMIEAQLELEVAMGALGEEIPKSAQAPVYSRGGYSTEEPATELPCNVFGTVDRCDGMACEHDGNCFSGCCSVFVQGEAQRCMPLVGGDLCPIAIDVKEKQDEQDDYESSQDYSYEDAEDNENEAFGEFEDDESDPPMIEKGEHHSSFSESEDHIIPVKGEHHFNEGADEEYENAEHFIPQKGEHDEDVHQLSKDKWKAEYHGSGEDEEDAHETVHEKKEAEHASLKPKVPMADDPRLVIPQGKATAEHDHPIMSKEPVVNPEHVPHYGEAYEHDRKEAIQGGSKESAGLAPKQPLSGPFYPMPRKTSRKPCSAYGEIDRCDGMTCDADEECASQCCGQLT